jgi:hypothetical protein
MLFPLFSVPLIKIALPIKGSGRSSLGPELVHGEQILDVIVEELLEELLRGVAILLGPLFGGFPLNVSSLNVTTV